MINKKGQEEMVGFALIIILVAVILLFFLGFALTGKGETSVDSYEAESFVQSFLQYTTRCELDFSRLDVQDLIFSCINQETCNTGEKACSVLNSTLQGIVDSGWNVGNESFYKAYELRIESNERVLSSIEKGSKTRTYKRALQNFAQSGDSVNIIFGVYS